MGPVAPALQLVLGMGLGQADPSLHPERARAAFGPLHLDLLADAFVCRAAHVLPVGGFAITTVLLTSDSATN